MNDPTIPLHDSFHLLLDEFRANLLDGKRPSIESVIARADESCRDELLKELIATDAEFRRKAGDTPLVADYRDRFPSLAAETIAALLHPPAGSQLDWAPLPSRYRVQCEIARGGMGAVLQVFDHNLDRDLAVKVMLPRAAEHTELVRRFQREARITGGLQHPGVPAVVELGVLEDQSPFFSMKLVQGQTLADLLRARTETDRQLDRLLPVYEQVAQTLAYAHSRGVIHRDVKPANIMVGAFGEVQVMDWGMAKQRQPALESVAAVTPEPPDDGQGPVTKTGASTVKQPSSEREDSTVAQEVSIDSTWKQPAGDAESPHELTQSGSVLGTPSYMPPEQARGQVEALDARADVFALGAMLLELLVGRPPYVGASPIDRLSQAQRGDLEPALQQLAASGADPALIELTAHCLQVDPDRRPADASEVARRLTEFLESLQQRLESERIQRAEAEIRAQEDRKRRRLTLAIAGLGLLLIVGIGAVAIWYQQDQTRRRLEARFEAEQVRREVGDLIEDSANLRRQGEWEAGATLLDNAQERLRDQPESTHRGLAAALAEAEIDLEAAESFERIVFKPYEMKYDEFMSKFRRDSFRGRDGGYAQTLNDYLDRRFDISTHVLDLSDAELARLRTSPLLSRMIQLIDKWSNEAADEEVQQAVYRLGLALDDNPDRSRIRRACLTSDMQVIEEMAAGVIRGEYDIRTIQLLAQVPLWEEDDRMRLRMLERALTRFPGDFGLRMTAAYLLQFVSGERDFQQAFVEAATGAVTLEPSNASAMFFYAGSQLATGDLETAAEAFGQVTQIDSRDIQAFRNRALCFMQLGQPQQAFETMQQAMSDNSDRWEAYEALGTFYYEGGRLAEARDLLERSLELRAEQDDWDEPIDAYLLALCLMSLGEPEPAMAALRRGRADNPGFTMTLAPMTDGLISLQQYRDAYEVLGMRIDDAASPTVDLVELQWLRVACAVQAAASQASQDPSSSEWETTSVEAGERWLSACEKLLEADDLPSADRSKLMKILAAARTDPRLESVREREPETGSEGIGDRWQALWTRVAELLDQD